MYWKRNVFEYSYFIKYCDNSNYESTGIEVCIVLAPSICADLKQTFFLIEFNISYTFSTWYIWNSYIVRTPPQIWQKGWGWNIFSRKGEVGLKGELLRKGGDSSLLYQIFIIRGISKWFLICLNFQNHFLKFQNKIRAPFLLLGTNMHILNLNIG